MNNKFISEGQLTGKGTLLLGVVGVSLILYTLFVSENLLLGSISIVVGLLFLGVAATANNAASIKLKPFTNDPLGWRKAKESYKASESEQGKSDHSSKS